MANENKKDFNAMLADNKDMPKIKIITDEKSIEKYGGSRMYFAPPANYDTVMKQVPEGKLITVGMLRDFFARKAGADFTDPITAGIFVSIAAWASRRACRAVSSPTTRCSASSSLCAAATARITTRT